jgi:hypothetical protein
MMLELSQRIEDLSLELISPLSQEVDLKMGDAAFLRYVVPSI